MDTLHYQRVRELFHKVIELPIDQRAKFLDSECKEDTILRSAVEELLRHHSPDTLIAPSTDKPSVVAHRDTTPVGNAIRKDQKTLPERIAHRFTRQFQRETRVVWVLGILALALLGLLSVWVHRSVQQAVRSTISDTMQALLDEQVFSLGRWLESETSLIKSWSRSSKLRAAVADLYRESAESKDPKTDLVASKARLTIRQTIHELNGSSENIRYAVWSRDRMLIADSNDDSPCLGNTITSFGGSILSRAFSGEDVLWLPTTSGFITQGYVPPKEISKPGLSLIVPIYSPSDDPRPIACMMVGGRNLQSEFEELFTLARFGGTGEAYAVDKRGYLITESRFGDQLQRAGMITEGPNSFSAQMVRVADPGGNISVGFQPDNRFRDEWPLTRAAASVLAGHAGKDFNGYVDYRGVQVVGAWHWLEKYDFGVIAEMDYDAAFEPLRPLNRAYALLLGLLGLTTLGFAGVSLALVRARKAAGMATQLGPYTVDKKIGEGGSSQVFLGTHQLLKRPTALKLLKPGVINEKNQSRREKEIRIASSLNHPNTIEIYDYGQTPDGVFYAAMEYVDGINLSQLVEIDGAQKPERVVKILIEVCRSLREAHARGLIHRDIKLQNIMLGCGAGEADWVKVLDFGLACDVDQDQNRLTETRVLVGTPMYIAPERIANPSVLDPRSDIFSLGVVAYVLLTGREPFAAVDAVEMLAKTLNADAPRASDHAPNDIPKVLDVLVSRCQSRDIEKRISTIDEVLRCLGEVICQERWTPKEASQWWWDHAPEVAQRNQLPKL